MKELTKAEEQLMQILWKIEKGFVNNIMEEIPEPKPAYNTVSTIVRILEKKGFVGHKAYGKTHEYFPLISKDEYSKEYMGSFVKNYFQNSYQQLVSFFASGDNLSIKELEEIRSMMDEQIKKNKKSKNK
ncbi:MAG: transcriptional regulator [Bacteroidetes bacterium GWF2_38_335]|nr:MAG: transcriptional regulator [Bacteroidetes bacterium GWF2_38_335]OFY80939.1 MAG: transcriptional regulator [Bacteroidetes bacterium RIFOXYA12_FULL_38_20]HBS85126.1 transcriptional regulator [Bacteroidales bacterium]